MKLTPGIECLSFEYHKDSGNISQREVVKFDLQANGNFLCVDLTDFDDAETTREIASVLSDAKRAYLDSVYASLKPYGVQIKTFTPSKMKNVKDTTGDLFRDAQRVS